MKQKLKKVSLVILVLFTTVFGIMFAKVSPVSAATTRLYINPPSIIDPTKTPSSTFTVNCTVQDVTNLWNWQVKVYFSPSILECTNAIIPSGSPFAFPIQPTPIIDNVEGYVMLGASKIGATPGVSGSGVLAVIEFHVKGVGMSGINYSKPYGESTFLKDNTMTLITPVNVEDGFFSNWVPPPPAKLYVNPPRVVDPTLTPCNEFNVTISIINATSLHAWDLNLYYNTTILTATNVFEGDFLKSGGITEFMSEIQNDFNATHGLIRMSCTLSNSAEVSGNGVLAIITFHVENYGDTPITIANDVLYDSMGNLLPHNTFHGYFNNLLIAKISVDPSEIIDPKYVPSTTFEINITLDDADSMKICKFNFTYNTDVLDFVGYSIYKVNDQIPSTKVIQDEEAGFIWFNLTYPSSITTFVPVPLVRIELHVAAFGSSPLNLTDTSLTGPFGQPIVHEAHHGFFAAITRDVAVIDIALSTTLPYRGWLVYINVTVQNKGDLAETFDVKAYYNSTLISTIPVVNLPSHENTTITFTWNTSSVPACNHYTISAEAMPVPYETSLVDNSLTDGTVKVRYPGDINNDGMITMDDIGLIAMAYATAPGHPRWNPQADINQDGIVDIMDIGLTALNYGKGCPP